jgi:autotransporter-associated beta strand protein
MDTDSTTIPDDSAPTLGRAQVGKRKGLLRFAAAAFSVFILLASSWQSRADVLSQYTFGPNGSTPGILSPTSVFPGVTASDISADPGLLLDLSNPATQPPSSPFLRTTFTSVAATPEAAVAAEADFKFTLTANDGVILNLTSLVFDVMRGGASEPRGYEVRSSVDNYATSLGTAAVPTVRPTFTNVTISLAAPQFQGLSSITFKIYSYSPGTGASVDYDNITINGTTATTEFVGYTWKGNTNANWNTTSANWTGPGTVYVDATPASNVRFDDTASVFAVTVAAPVNPNSMLLNNATAYSFSGSSITVAQGITKNLGGTVTFNNAVSAASVIIANGTIAVSGTGSLTSPNIGIAPTGALTVAAGGSLGESTGLTVNGAATFNNAAQTLLSLSDTLDTPGIVTLNGTVLTITGSGTYTGQITGTGSLVKTTGGTLTLGGFNSDYSGGTAINGGALQVTNIGALGTGGVTVNPGGALSIGAGISNPITLAGGTIGVAAAASVPAPLTVTAPSTITVFNPVSGATPNDLILLGMLQGTGNLNVESRNNPTPDAAAFRLRGPISTGPTAYTGTITLANSAKFELQTSESTGSPMGTGKLVVTGGTTSAGNAGTYSLVNVRNSTGGDVDFGNEVEVAGFGAAYFNLLGGAPAGSSMSFGKLTIGDGQIIGAVATASQEFTLAFATVQLTGGNATFVPQPVANTSFLSVENIRLGPISETVAGSGIIAEGAARLILAGANTYTGPTVVRSGTLEVNGSISGSSQATIEGGTLRGSGTTGPLELIGGTLAPGNGPGVLGTRNLAFTSGTLSLEIVGNTPGDGFIGYDQIDVTGNVALNGLIDLLLNFDFYDPVDSVDSFTIVKNDSTEPIIFGSTNSRFAYNGLLLNQGTTFTATSGALSQDFSISYTGGDGNDIVLTAVPEPSTALILLGSLASLAGLARPRRRAA